MYLDADIFAEGAFEDRSEVVDEGGDVGGFGSKRLLPSKGEKTGGEFCAA